MSSRFRVALANYPFPASGDESIALAEQAVAEAGLQGARIVCLPECFVPGSPTTSAIINPDGTLLRYQPYGAAGLLIAEVDLDSATGLLARRCRTAD